MSAKESFFKELNRLRSDFQDVASRFDRLEMAATTFSDRADRAEVRRISQLEEELEKAEKRREREIERLEKEIQRLNDLVAKGVAPVQKPSEVLLHKARTIAIFDTILNAISLWSQSGNIASDVELACQSILFPSVYERVMRGDDPAYILDDIPFSAYAVVTRGREFVKWIRSECDTHITTPEAWEKYAPIVQEWWRNDGLPLIYGEADPAWATDKVYTLADMEVWRNNPSDRMLEFPLIYDAMDLVQKSRSEVNSSTQLVNFTRQIAATRLP